MAIFELVLVLLLGGVCLALLAPRIGIPWPSLLALAGAALAFVPGIPDVNLDPELALTLFVAPVLLDAAFDASPRDLRRNWLSVGSLVLGAVTVTVAAVAVTAHGLRPELPWGAAVALGAIVAPPDAAAAAAVLKQVRLPHQLSVILEGESLLNDASALLIYRLAVTAAIAGITAWDGFALVLGAGAGVILGFVLARIYLAVMSRVTDQAAATVLAFLSTFGVWLLGDALGLSAVLTMVAFAVALARSAPGRLGARQRRASYAVWDVVVFVLNVLAFIFVGLQLRGILARLDVNAWPATGFAAAILAVTILVRLAWVMSFYWAARPVEPTSSVGGGLVISWCGMRGIVTLAAALALPNAFPGRDLIVFTAFCVTLGTLVLQGATLRPLLHIVSLTPDGSVEDEVAGARQELAHAGLAALEGMMDAGPDEPARRLMQEDYRARLSPDAASLRSPGSRTGLVRLRSLSLAAERSRLASLRREERIGDAAFQVLEEELDWAEAGSAGLSGDHTGPR